jgi:alkylation response protein AidB-like acyl-CoA dehydrogenase
MANEFHDTVRRFTRAAEIGPPGDGFQTTTWTQLAELGALALTVPGTGGTAGDVCRCMVELGAVGFVGPLVESFMAAMLLPAVEAARLADGSAIATVAWDDLVPWGDRADIVVLIARSGDAHLVKFTARETVATLAGDRWARGRMHVVADLGIARIAVGVGELAIASYVVGAALRAVDISVEYARVRSQFGRPIGDYQAISHPLADAFGRLSGLLDVLTNVRVEFGALADPEWTEWSARLRLIADDAAAAASYAALQTHGGMGFVRGVRVTELAMRARQIALTGVPRRVSEERAAPAHRNEAT